MTSSEAREILFTYRHGTADDQDPEVLEAMQVVRQDPELSQWFDQHQVFQAAMRAKLRQIEVPAHLKSAILARQKTIPAPIPWRGPVWIAAAAAVALLIGLASFWSRPPVPDRFHNFRDMMVSMAIRQYRMDLTNSDMAELRRYVAARGAPADYQLTPGLESLELTGGAALSWRTNPVSMVCFKETSTNMVYLFAMKRSAIKDPPPQTPKLAKVNAFLTASWTKGDLAYVLAAADKPGFASRYLPPGAGP